ncbi:MAG: type II toxin-antitoxin system RelE/ParE family toxin [Deltaproteobacteria bacterium]|nr:type II toxin-antitoxin system RelE/ParE family toxin [Deltaproteobacteria bacterium]
MLLSPLAARQIKKMKGNRDLPELLEAIDSLAQDPRPPESRTLAGYPFRRLRVAGFRVIYAVEEERVVVLVLKVGQR